MSVKVSIITLVGMEKRGGKRLEDFSVFAPIYFKQLLFPSFAETPDTLDYFFIFVRALSYKDSITVWLFKQFGGQLSKKGKNNMINYFIL